MTKRLPSLAIGLLLGFSGLTQSIIYVNATATGGNNGQSWSNAFTSLHAALDTADYGTQIWVAAGTYYPEVTPTGYAQSTNNRTWSFYIKNGVKLYGGFSGNETTLDQRNRTANPTILSGDIGQPGVIYDNAYHVLTIDNADPTTLVDGFIIEKGRADGSSSPNYDVGGGLYNHGDNFLQSNPTIANCLFRDNYAYFSAGAVYNAARWDGAARPTFIQCIFYNNESENGSPMRNYARARGICSPKLFQCTFAGNTIPIGVGIVSVLEFLAPSGTVSTVELNNSILWHNAVALNKGVIHFCLVDSLPNGGVTSSNSIIESDPLFVNIDNGDLSLNANSPAINAGSNALAPAGLNVDFGDNPRFSNETIDIGAWEYQSSAVTPLVATCQSQTIYLSPEGIATIAANAFNGGSTGAGTLQFLVNDQSVLNFNCENIGNQAISLTVTDDQGQTAQCTTSITILDTIAPVIYPAAIDTVWLDLNGTYTLHPEDLLDWSASYDNCGDLSLVGFSPQQVSCDQVNQTVSVQLTVSDGAGNQSHATAFVFVAINSAPPTPWEHTDIGMSTGNAWTQACPPPGETIAVQSSAVAGQYHTDQRHFLFQEWCGDFSITTQVFSISSNGWAGAMCRESLEETSKMVAVKSQLGNVVTKEVRMMTGGGRSMQQFSTAQSAQWLRLVRAGNTFTAFISVDGQQWEAVFSQNLEMQDCLLVGVFDEADAASGPSTAVFGNILLEMNGTTASEAPSDQSLRIFPNPARDILHLDWGSTGSDVAMITVYNTSGQIVLQQVSTTSGVTTISMADIVTGYYILSVRIRDQLPIVQKLVVQQ